MARKAMPDSPLAALRAPKRKAKTKTAKGEPPTKAAATKADKRPRTLHLPAELDRRLRLHAAANDQTVSDVIAAAVEAWLKGR